MAHPLLTGVKAATRPEPDADSRRGTEIGRAGICGQPQSDPRPISHTRPSVGTTKEIAADLYVTPETVKTRAAHLYAKLGLSVRQAAARQAAELCLLAPA